MAKSRRTKKQKISTGAPVQFEVSETRYYWCVNCGVLGDYGFLRKRGLVCEACKYEFVVEYSLEDYESKMEQYKTGGFKCQNINI